MSETTEQMTTAVIAWARLVFGASPMVFLGGTGSIADNPIVEITFRSSVPDGPIEVVYDGDDTMRSQVQVSTLEIAAMGQGGTQDLVRRLLVSWTSEGALSAPLRAAKVVPVGDGGTTVDSFRRLGGAGLVRASVTTIRARHRVGWRTADDAGLLVTEISGTIDGEPSGDATFSVRLVPVLQVGSGVLTVGPSLLELSA